jgi:hypothetical protein
LGQFLRETGATLDAEDEGSFPMRLPHFRRTFVEEMFAIHARVELLKREGRPLGTYARHYYDLFQLAAQPEVQAMLMAEEYREIKTDYDRIGRAHFARNYFHPEDMRFAASDALFPPPALAAVIAPAYEAQCVRRDALPVRLGRPDSAPMRSASSGSIAASASIVRSASVKHSSAASGDFIIHRKEFVRVRRDIPAHTKFPTTTVGLKVFMAPSPRLSTRDLTS